MNENRGSYHVIYFHIAKENAIYNYAKAIGIRQDHPKQNEAMFMLFKV